EHLGEAPPDLVVRVDLDGPAQDLRRDLEEVRLLDDPLGRREHLVRVHAPILGAPARFEERGPGSVREPDFTCHLPAAAGHRTGGGRVGSVQGKLSVTLALALLVAPVWTAAASPTKHKKTTHSSKKTGSTKKKKHASSSSSTTTVLFAPNGSTPALED